MKFNIDNYKGKYVMHCKTEEEAIDFCNYLHSVGRERRSGKLYWSNNVVYYFNEGTIGSLYFAERDDYTILEWSDFMNKEFTKADLKTGDIILRRNGAVEIVNRELETFITPKGWNDFDEMNEDLTSNEEYKYDIVAVRRSCEKSECQFKAFEHKWGTLIYERKEVEEITLSEVCKLLGKKSKLFQKNKNS